MKKEYADPCADRIRGCLVGGAAGDALGYPVEFLSDKGIRKTYGEQGIRSYVRERETGLAVVSDDTQMTMYTATGILYGELRGWTRGIYGKTYDYVYVNYMDWLHTQNPQKKEPGVSWIREIPQLQVRRAPGNTCLSALESGSCGSRTEPINGSKGCGGIMRVAPVALFNSSGEQWKDIRRVDLIGADVAAVTHGHPLGYIPAAALVHLIRRIVYGGGRRNGTLYDIAAECRETMEELFKGNPYLPAFLKKLDDAAILSQNSASDRENIRRLGEGWVAEETFAIALYCSLRYSYDFSAALIASVNHDGDSDSTGAVTGNIMGALTGCSEIPECWKEGLQFYPVLLELADDLYFTREILEKPRVERKDLEERGLLSKYVQGSWKPEGGWGE